MSERKAIRPYHHPAGGWGALKAVGEHLIENETLSKVCETTDAWIREPGVMAMMPFSIRVE